MSGVKFQSDIAKMLFKPFSRLTEVTSKMDVTSVDLITRVLAILQNVFFCGCNLGHSIYLALQKANFKTYKNNFKDDVKSYLLVFKNSV
jgi:hypothetical protein